MPGEFIYTVDDTLRMLDELLVARDGAWWNGFFADRAKPCPFFVDWPDENLVEWVAAGRVTPGRVLELGCGHGRNAVFLAGQGWRVDAVDFSAEAIDWARQQASTAKATVNFVCSDIFDLAVEEAAYDSGCWHHLAPHRRRDYVQLVNRALKPGSHFGLVCFRPEGGSDLTDQQVYENRSLGGGLGYSQEALRAVWDAKPFSVQVLRPMVEQGGPGPSFGAGFLWALLATKELP